MPDPSGYAEAALGDGASELTIRATLCRARVHAALGEDADAAAALARAADLLEAARCPPRSPSRRLWAAIGGRSLAQPV